MNKEELSWEAPAFVDLTNHVPIVNKRLSGELHDLGGKELVVPKKNKEGKDFNSLPLEVPLFEKQPKFELVDSLPKKSLGSSPKMANIQPSSAKESSKLANDNSISKSSSKSKSSLRDFPNDNDPFGDENVLESMSFEISLSDTVSPFIIPSSKFAEKKSLPLTSSSKSITFQKNNVEKNESSTRKVEHVQINNDDNDIAVAKRHILQNPQYLINVLVFWINLKACHGSARHNHVVMQTLKELQQTFEDLSKAEMTKLQKHRTQNSISQNSQTESIQKIDTVKQKTNDIVNTFSKQANDLQLDTTYPLITMVNAIGPFVLRYYLLQKKVITLNFLENDVSTAWLHVMAASDPLFHDCTASIGSSISQPVMTPEEMLRRMEWSTKLPLPI